MKKAFKALGIAILYLLIFETVQTVVSIAASVAIAVFCDPTEFVSAVYYFTNMLGVVADFICIAILLLIIRAFGKNIKTELDINPINLKSALACLVGGIALVVLVNNVLAFLPIPESVWQEYADASQALMEGPKWAQIVFTVIAAPLCEEIVFRGLVYNNCRKGMPMAAAVIIGALLFGVVHGQFLWVCYAAACGFFLIMAYNNTGSLIGCLLMHMGFNGFSQFVPESWDMTGIGWTIISAVVLVSTYVIMRPVKAIDNDTKEALL